MRYISAIVMAIAILFPGCSGQKRVQYMTSAINVSEVSHPERYSLVYSIPKTTLEISVEVKQIITRRGPYYQFAERYLGISDVTDRDHTRWIIDNVKIESYHEADPEHYYLLTTNDRHVTNFFKMVDEGLILPVNQKQMPELEGYSHYSVPDQKKPLYSDLSIHPIVIEETRTVMRMVKQDTAFVNVPVMQRQSVTKSLEARAAEAADLIFELRSNRFKLLSGDLDLFPDGTALGVIIDEFARLEQEYLNLFTGKVFETRHEFKFDYSPGTTLTESGNENIILFRFSDSEGVLATNDDNGRPVTLELQNEMKTARLDNIQGMYETKINAQGRLFYRIPDAARVRLTDGSNIIAGKRMLVSQYGKIVTLPADFLWE